MLPRTSQSHPIAIAEIRPFPQMGRIGITFCPGKTQADAMSGRWERDLGQDLDAIARWGAAAVVTLVESHELDQLGVTTMGDETARRHLGWFHLPIPDVTAPGPAFETQWDDAGAEIRQLLRLGFDVLIHCKGGLGRAGTIAARILIELCWSAPDAISSVRHVRPGAIETVEQVAHLHRIPAEKHQQASPVPSLTDRCLGALVGLAIGDAVGTTLEFQPRDSAPPLCDMVGGGPFRLEPGQWTDDTAMALALADSLIKRRGLDEHDLMTRFVSWWKAGQYSCTGTCFDIGITTRSALATFEATGNPIAGSTDPRSAGNGSLMRLAPVLLHHVGRGSSDMTALADLARAQSRVTHGAIESVEACAAFAQLFHHALSATTRVDLFDRAATICTYPSVDQIMAGSWRGKHRNAIPSSGYALHSLEASLWCIARTASFRDAILLAANLGDDADTTAAITGQLAGAYYGIEGIPAKWLERLAWSDRIMSMGQALLAPTDELG